MVTLDKLHSMEDHELINEVLRLQKLLSDITPTESVSSQIHNYHFASNEILKLTKSKFAGSGFILSIMSLSGKPIIKPITISGGFSNEVINGLLDELQNTFNYKTELKPTTKRL